MNTDFRVTAATASFRPRHHDVSLLISGRAGAVDHDGSFELTVPQARDLRGALDVALHLADALRRGVVPVDERTG